MGKAAKPKGRTKMTGKYAKKILFNISQAENDQMTAMRLKRGLDQSEYIRRAIRMYVAERKLGELSSLYQ